MISMILSVFSWFPFVGAYLRSFSGHFFKVKKVYPQRAPHHPWRHRSQQLLRSQQRNASLQLCLGLGLSLGKQFCRTLHSWNMNEVLPCFSKFWNVVKIVWETNLKCEVLESDPISTCAIGRFFILQLCRCSLGLVGHKEEEEEAEKVVVTWPHLTL